MFLSLIIFNLLYLFKYYYICLTLNLRVTIHELDLIVAVNVSTRRVVVEEV